MENAHFCLVEDRRIYKRYSWWGFSLFTSGLIYTGSIMDSDCSGPVT